MIYTTYELSNFEAAKAASGALVVMVVDDYTGDTISNITYDSSGSGDNIVYVWKTNTDFMGSGICKFSSPNNYILTVESVAYRFDEKGSAVSLNAKGYKLMMGKIHYDTNSGGTETSESSEETEGGSGSSAQHINTNPNINQNNSINPRRLVDTTLSGNVGRSNVVAAFTRTDSGIATNVAPAETPNYVSIDSMTVRDEFALQALRGILSHIPDPSVLSDNEMNEYCSKAYRWASNMMDAAANARASFTDSGQSSSVPVNVSGLDSNVEKLLNNMVYAIEHSSGGGGSTDVSGIVAALKDNTASPAEKTVSGAITTINNALHTSQDSIPLADIQSQLIYPQLLNLIAALRTTDNTSLSVGDVLKRVVNTLIATNADADSIADVLDNMSSGVYNVSGALKGTNDKTVSKTIDDKGTSSNKFHVQDAATTSISASLMTTDNQPVGLADVIGDKGKDSSNAIHVYLENGGGGIPNESDLEALTDGDNTHSFAVFENNTGNFKYVTLIQARKALKPYNVQKTDLNSVLDESIVYKDLFDGLLSTLHNSANILIEYIIYNNSNYFLTEISTPLLDGDYIIALGANSTYPSLVNCCFLVKDYSEGGTNYLGLHLLYNERTGYSGEYYNWSLDNHTIKNGVLISSSSMSFMVAAATDYAVNILMNQQKYANYLRGRTPQSRSGILMTEASDITSYRLISY